MFSQPWQMTVNANLGRFTGIRNSVAVPRADISDRKRIDVA